MVASTEDDLELPVTGYEPSPTKPLDFLPYLAMTEDNVLRTIEALGKLDRTDGRWLAIARTDIEKGFMSMRRALFPPRSATPAEDEHSPPLGERGTAPNAASG